ncbi:hypothetical protein F5X99DRAFT_395229 [Biscogniauxia marginata]|nr:hypothetical protein F5X99DRAFT_395229 [Biscogniauxia marginata]
MSHISDVAVRSTGICFPSMHPGNELACAMWAMAALSLALVFLRLYTRICVVKFVGTEDYMYACTGLFFLLFTIFIQISVQYGLGRSFWELSVDDSSNAIFWTYVANSFAIIGNAMAKLSMGLFLLRVVQIRWHKVALWGAVIVTAATSTALTIMLWNQTTPIKASWDPLRTKGKWNISIQPMSVGLGVWSSVCDFFFAVFPWLFIWSLRMPRRDKFMLAGGMSLGVIAGACGITRTVVLSQLNVYNYTLNFVPYFAWAGAEIAIAMVCIGVPTLRPLYLKARGLASTYGNQGRSNAGDTPQFTMCDRKAASARTVHDSGFSHSRTDSNVTKPPNTYTRCRSDSVDDIISEYQNHNTDTIWVNNGVRARDDIENWPLRD